MQTKVMERIRNEIDIVKIISEYLNLTKKGNNYLTICPFHEDSRPSLTISQTKQIFKCFACGHGGDVISFVSDYEKITFQQAIQKLASILGIDVVIKQISANYNEKELQILSVLKDANDFFMNSLMTKQGKTALDYTKTRNLTWELIEKFNIGFCPENGLLSYLESKNHDQATMINASLVTKSLEPFFKNRLTFAIKNRFGEIVAFSGRNLNDQELSKYVNSRESSLFNKNELFYNYFDAQQSIEKTGEILIVEGFMDVIALHKVNINNAVALMGTNLSHNHIKLLKNKKVLLMLDNDQAGIRATLQTIKILVKNNIALQIINYELDGDADQIFNKGNVELLNKTLNQKVSWIEFVYKHLIPPRNIDSHLPINDFIDQFKNYLLLSNELEWEFYINKISNHFNLSKETIISLLPHKMKTIGNQANLITSEKKLVSSEINPQKYDNILIRSMLKNPQYIEIFKNSDLSFSDKDLILISKYLVNYQKNAQMPLNIKKKCFEILNSDFTIASSPLEFQEYIDRIKWTNKQITNHKIIESIKKINDPNIAMKLLEQQIKLKKGK